MTRGQDQGLRIIRLPRAQIHKFAVPNVLSELNADTIVRLHGAKDTTRLKSLCAEIT